MIAAEQRIGELLLAIPTSQGRRTDKETSVERSTKVETKNQTIERMGYGTTEAKDYQQMAKQPKNLWRILHKFLEQQVRKPTSNLWRNRQQFLSQSTPHPKQEPFW